MAEFTVKNAEEIRDDILRTLKNGLIQRGIANPSVGYGSDWYVMAQAVANELSVVAANTVVRADEQMPDTATGEALDRLADMYGLTRRNASGAYGNVVFNSSASIFVAAGSQLTDSKGNRFQVATGATYANGDDIPVIGVDGGISTNHEQGETLRWVSAPPYAAPTVLVGVGDLTGGVEDEDDETLRARLLSRLQNPPGGGNWQQVAQFAENASSSVQKAFVYPAANGPSTVHVAVAGYTSSASKERDISTAIMTGTVQPYVAGQIAEYAEATVTTVANEETDTAIFISLPTAPTASPAGPGGGWLDGTPWPSLASSTPTSTDGTVTVVTSSTRFTIDAQTLPTANVNRIAFIDRTNWTLYTATITTVYGGSVAGAVEIGIDTPWPNIEVGAYVWPQCVNQQLYVDAILNGFAFMGPGEKTSNTTALQRASRKPAPQLSWPYSLNSTLLRKLTDVGDEVLDVAYAYRYKTTPTVPGSIAAAPNILVPRFIGLYPL